MKGHQTAVENEENDIRINGSATDAQLEWKRQGKLVQKKKAAREDLEAFETAYNAACACIPRGEFSQAEFLLKRANGRLRQLLYVSKQNSLLLAPWQSCVPYRIFPTT